MRSLMMVLVMVMVMVMVVGCSGDDDGSNLSDLELLCDESSGVFTAHLADYVACGSPALRNPMFTRAYQANNCRGTYGPLLDAQAIVIDRDAVAKCRAALKTKCSPEKYKDWANAVLVCRDVIDGVQGTVSCSVDEECFGPAYCAITTGTCGTCTPKQVAGYACRSDHECESELCAAGGACLERGTLASGASCVDDVQCGTGLLCRNGVCKNFGESIGGGCNDDDDCGAYEGTCFTFNRQCLALAEEGQACSPAPMAQSFARCKWFEGMGCLDGMCKPMPHVAEGQPCGYDLALCAGELQCVFGECSAIVPEGGACVAHEQCGPYAVCLDRVCSFTDFRNTCTPAVGP